jgi:formylglycine-generating enzyme required for sulfatase activity/serine/threonine protein kinase
MPALPPAHPSQTILVQLGAGQLDDAGAEAVFAHLDVCPECRARAASLSGDDLLRRLRAAHAAGPGAAETASSGTLNPSAAPAASPSAVPPELLHHPQYEIVRELGRGGMGVVYLARNRAMNRLEVLKVVSRQLLDQPGLAERFRGEISAAAQLTHQNIAVAYATPPAGDLLVFAMEYVEGDNLAEVVQHSGPLPVGNACYYAQQAAAGLQHAFEKGMVHRDIKPSNLILARQGKRHVVKVIDFGLARATRAMEGTGHRLTRIGQLLGTPDYIAPEQILDAARADIRADVYSLGCTLYFLLAGRPPFQGESLYEVLEAHHLQQAEPLNQVRPEVPAKLADVVAKMMAKDPAERYQAPKEAAQALAPFVETKLKPLPATPPPEGGKPRPVNRATMLQKARPDRQDEPKPPGAAPVIAPTKIEGSAVMAAPATSAAGGRGREPDSAAARRWLLGSIAAGVLLAGVLGLWAGGVFRLRTPEGTLVVKVDEPNVDVYVDGDKMTVTWGKDGTTAEVRVKPGTRKVEVKRDGLTVFGEEVEVQSGERLILAARLVSTVAPGQPPKQEKPPAKPADQPPPSATPVVPGPPGKEGERPVKPPDQPPPVAGDIVARVKTVAGIDLVSVPAGEFYMGSGADDKDAWDDEKPRHKVTISKPFYLGKYKVTVGQFKRFVQATGYKTEAEKAGDSSTWKQPGFAQTDEHPVVYLSWNDAHAFCQWLAEETGAKVRLPSEAEWEYSCRAGTTTKFYFGDNEADLGDYAWYAGNSGFRTHPCGRKKPNAFGLFDMHGLAWEWCVDGKQTYTDDVETDPEGPTSAGASRVSRGGSFDDGPRLCRAADRCGRAPSYRYVVIGFRVLVSR